MAALSPNVVSRHLDVAAMLPAYCSGLTTQQHRDGYSLLNCDTFYIIKKSHSH
ncbi:hypothetical protein GBAR_LOCUS10371 [Geodia barretti]|uniref:Uncharacterized protein n=1 Tax=Geodia barretti TaxID=519541 RepID=A0AA35RUW5_GEOBA|nr:hypothetical protein GBAR_LOCUS10371 [Geodia barretti]